MNGRICSLLIFVALPLKADSLETKGWLAFGDLRGHFEPCGCNPKTDLGGILRIATAVFRERRESPNLFLFSLGNHLPAEIDTRKTKFIQEGVSLLKATANLLNESELLNLDELQKINKTSEYLISNQRHSELRDAKHVVHVDNTYIFGYTYQPQFKNLLEPFDDALLKRWDAAVKSKSAKKVLLFSGTDSDLAKIGKTMFFDLIISSNPTPLDVKSEIPVQLPAQELLRKIDNISVRFTPISGQGLLRGGYLSKAAAPSLSDLLAKKTSEPQFGNQSKIESIWGNPVTWLDESYDDGSPLEELSKKYQNAAHEEFERLVRKRLVFLKDTPYIGSEACVECHKNEVDIWRKSSHATAHNTLVTAQKDKDPECVGCHVVGFSDAGGFVSLKDSPYLANVSCENCHGPRKAHAILPSQKQNPLKKAKDTCVECHHGTHTPDFDFEKFWKKIEH